MPALSLERHFFSKIELRPHFDAKMQGVLTVVCNFTVSQAADNPRKYQGALVVNMNEDPKNEGKPSYTGSVEIIGIFVISEQYKEDPVRLVNVTGASLLYGAVRELVCNLTARGPWPMVTLSTMSFVPQAQSKPEEERLEISDRKPEKTKRK